MVCSPEQLAANRRNALKSTGPKTAGGKAASRRNGLKHGLTGAGVVVADEDAAALDDRFEAFEADLRPANAVAAVLARRAALLSIRLERSAREEAARITLDMIEAEEFEEDARAIELEHLVGLLKDRPAEAVRRLRRSEEGIARLIEEWRVARRDLFEVGGIRWMDDRAGRLTGLDFRLDESRRVAALVSAMLGNFTRLGPADWPDLPPAARQEAARGELAAYVDAQVADLEHARGTLDRDRIARARAGTAARALFNPSKEATLARKYEAATERGFFRTLARIEEINAQAEAEADVEAEVEVPAEVEAGGTIAEGATCDEMGSSFPGPTSRFDRLERADRPAARGEANAPEGARSRGNAACPSP